jgi:hypothetical protein
MAAADVALDADAAGADAVLLLLLEQAAAVSARAVPTVAAAAIRTDLL